MFRRLIASFVCLTFITATCPAVFAQDFSVSQLPIPGTMVSISPSFEPALIKGLTVHKDNPFLFDFIVDPGQFKVSKADLKDESERMIKYFFAALTIPDKDVWVNLSPYEKDRMIPVSLGQTAMGRDLLAQDYMLKQLTASLIYPQKALGKTFWDTVYSKAKEMYGTTQIPVNTFNKVWIVPKRVGIYEHGQTAFIVDGHLKVMLEEDYLSMTKHNAITSQAKESRVNQLGSQIIKSIILPEIEKEINDGKNFATLRQIFYAQALAVWFKHNLKQALLNQVYANKGTVKGIDQNDAKTNEAIYHQYLKAYKKGVFNYIQQDVDPVTQETMLRKYFSGGYTEKDLDAAIVSVGLPPGAVNGQEQEAKSYIDETVAVVSNGADAAALAFKADAAMANGIKKSINLLVDSMAFTRDQNGYRVALDISKQPVLEAVLHLFAGDSLESSINDMKLWLESHAEAYEMTVADDNTGITFLTHYPGIFIFEELLRSFEVYDEDEFDARLHKFGNDFLNGEKQKLIAALRKYKVISVQGNKTSVTFQNTEEFKRTFDDYIAAAVPGFRANPRLYNLLGGYTPDEQEQKIREAQREINQEIREVMQELFNAIIGSPVTLTREFTGYGFETDLDENTVRSRIDEATEEDAAMMTIDSRIRNAVALLKTSEAAGILVRLLENKKRVDWLSVSKTAQDDLKSAFRLEISEIITMISQYKKWNLLSRETWNPKVRIQYLKFMVLKPKIDQLLTSESKKHVHSPIQKIETTFPPSMAISKETVPFTEDSVHQWLIEQTQGDPNVVVEISTIVLKRFGLSIATYDQLDRMLYKIFKMKATSGPGQMSMYYKGFSDGETISLRSLMDENSPQNVIALVDLKDAIDSNKTIIEEGQSRRILNEKGLVDANGNIPESIRSKMPLTVEGEGLMMRLSSPKSHLRDRAMAYGGIDLSQQDEALHVEKDANGGVKVSVDKALIARIERGGTMSEVDPVIIDMQPADARSIFGVEATVRTPVISPV